MQHVEKETNVGQLQGEGSQKRRNDKGAALPSNFGGKIARLLGKKKKT